MLFTSYGFIGFVSILCILYYTCFRRLQWILLLLAGYVFYAFYDPRYLIFILATTLTIYFATIQIGKNYEVQKAYLKENKQTLSKEEKKAYKDVQKKKRTRWQVACVLVNLGILAVVKYASFFVANIESVMHLFGSEKSLGAVNFLVPLGISFYTFQALSYLIDVSRGTIEPEKNPAKLALFISFFPLLVQGPISRFSQLGKTLYTRHDFDSDTFTRGLMRVMWGFFKKLVVADRILPGVTTIISDIHAYNGGYAFFGMLFYTIQLYADFTGGIDITIGVAQMLGVEVTENFNLPYFSTSLKEYWRRWHITMCNWFRDYIFYPVSTSNAMMKLTKRTVKIFGQKVGKRIPVYVSSFLVWFATGIWHGASWNFIVWGLLNWLILMVSEELEGLYDGFHKRCAWTNGGAYKIFMILRTFLLICVLNLFDCFSDVRDTIGALLSMFTSANWSACFSGGLLDIGLSASDYLAAGIGVLVMLTVSLIKLKKPDVRGLVLEKPFAARYAICFLLFTVILVFGAYGIGYESGQFIYNRF